MYLKSKIESLLFISAKPMAVKQLASLFKAEAKEVEKDCDLLMQEYQEKGSGLQIIKAGLSYQMVTLPANAKLVQEFLKEEISGELTRPSLEALTIIAYRGPIAKIDLDRIRGVNCALIIRNLLLRGLIEAKFDKKKQETYYSVSFDFIRFLGLNQLKDLPDYERLHQDDTLDRMLADSKENF